MPHLILFNPASGRGKAQSVAACLHAALSSAGHDSILIPTTRAQELVEPASTVPRVLFVVGGDGTVHRALDLARRHDLAIYHVPMGTENLFSREFAMARDVALAARSLDAPRFRSIDLATCSRAGDAPVTFAIMCSVGPDAAVIRRLSAARTGPIRHASYLAPIAHELLNFQLPPLTIFADGQALVRDEPGLTVIANSRQYALRVDPAHMADMSDGLLDVIFFPAQTRIELLSHVLAARMRRSDENPSVLHRRARDVQITSPSPSTAYQLDGEAGEYPSRPPSFELSLQVVPSALRVLLPASPAR